MNILILSILLLVIDFIYLYFLGGIPFLSMIKNIQKSDSNIKISGGILAYICLIILLKIFIINNHKSPLEAFILGICVYGVFDGTNYALLNNYDLFIGIQDILWGGILLYLVTYFYNKIEKIYL
jgi:uncharacterized membrane protein